MLCYNLSYVIFYIILNIIISYLIIYYTILYYVILYYTSIILYYIILYCIVLCFLILYHFISCFSIYTFSDRPFKICQVNRQKGLPVLVKHRLKPTSPDSLLGHQAISSRGTWSSKTSSGFGSRDPFSSGRSRRASPRSELPILKTPRFNCTLKHTWCLVYVLNIIENKATGWLAALVRVTNLKLGFSRLRDKMLVFVGLVKQCQKMFATWTFISIGRRVTQVQKFTFRLRRESTLWINIGNLWFKVSHANIHQIIHPFFFTSQSISAKVLSEADRDQIWFVHATAESASDTCQQRQQVPWAMCCTRQERYHTPPTPVDHKKACATC